MLLNTNNKSMYNIYIYIYIVTLLRMLKCGGGNPQKELFCFQLYKKNNLIKYIY